MKIAVIGGGNMGGAIAIGAIAQGVVSPCDITISHLSLKMRPLFEQHLEQITLTRDNPRAIDSADLIVVAVKPWLLEGVLGELSPLLRRSRQSIISVVAGVSFEALGSMLRFEELGSMPLYRVIPNTAIAVGCGVSIISSYGGVPQLDEKVRGLFDALGSTFMVDESQMASLTSLASCGIAFALRYLDASRRGGEAVGLSSELSLEVSIKTMEGALAMLKSNGSQPQAEIDKVTTKGGITLKGLEAMEREGFSAAVGCAIKESR